MMEELAEELITVNHNQFSAWKCQKVLAADNIPDMDKSEGGIEVSDYPKTVEARTIKKI